MEVTMFKDDRGSETISIRNPANNHAWFYIRERFEESNPNKQGIYMIGADVHPIHIMPEEFLTMHKSRSAQSSAASHSIASKLPDVAERCIARRPCVAKSTTSARLWSSVQFSHRTTSSSLHAWR
jgi:hypothetical protein